jgi:hypothetical protein
MPRKSEEECVMVNQSDREAAVEAHIALDKAFDMGGVSGQFLRDILDGERDDDPLVVSHAAHRESQRERGAALSNSQRERGAALSNSCIGIGTSKSDFLGPGTANFPESQRERGAVIVETHQMSNDYEIELRLKVHRETDYAWQVSADGELKNAVWIPKSEVDDGGTAAPGSTCEFLVPEWLAIEKGLV